MKNVAQFSGRYPAKPDGTGNPDKAKRKTRDHQTGKKLPPPKSPKPPPPEPELRAYQLIN